MHDYLLTDSFSPSMSIVDSTGPVLEISNGSRMDFELSDAKPSSSIFSSAAKLSISNSFREEVKILADT